jgi:hypothetical protein
MLAGLVAAACLAQGMGPGKPEWVETLPEAPGRLYALGTAPLGGNASEAISRASDRARLEVVARLRATVRGSTRITTRTTETPGLPAAGSGARQVLDQVSVGTRAEDLPGLVVERTHTDPAGGIAYALAYLDLAQAHAALAARLALARDGRLRVAGETTRKARWRLRKIQEDLGRLDELIGMLAVTGAAEDLRVPLQAERTAVETRLAQLEAQGLPPLELAKTAVGLRCNLDLPIGVEAYLGDQITACGLLHRDLNPDLILDLTFAGGARGPEFIYVDMDVYEGVSYRLKAQLTVLEGGGAALTRPVALEVTQSSSPEGMVDQFRRQLERRLPKLIAQAVAELQ